MRVAVSGAGGFIGRRVVRDLETRGVTVVPVPHQLLIAAGAGNAAPHGIFKSLLELRPHVFLHLAWAVQAGDWSGAARRQDGLITGTVRLTEALAGVGLRRVVAAGTCLEYKPASLRLTEASRLSRGPNYVSDKHRMHHALRRACALTDVEFIWNRLFYVYGPDDTSRRLIPTACSAIRRGQRVKLTDPMAVIDLIHVRDVARVLVQEATAGGPPVVNVGTGRPTTPYDVVTFLSNLDRHESAPVKLPKGPSTWELGRVADATLLAALGSPARVPLENGLRDLWSAT